ncbi:MAG: FecR domain-containing protein [Bacteroides sp.]|nr:FecR domain-containing protein [Bacteroides sp.]
MVTLEILKKIIERMLSGRLSADDRATLAEEQPFSSLLEEQWHNGREWHKIEKVDSQEIWNNISDECWHGKKSSAFNREKFFLRTVSWVAVGAIVLVAVWLIGSGSPYITVKAPLEAKRMLVLPDSSKVWLNAAASVKYKKEFLKDREVELVGEGFFDVAKMNGKPFIVRIGDACVEVKGTEFNVKKISAMTTVTLFTGSVEFSVSTLNKTFMMKPNEQIIYNEQTKAVELENVDVEEYDWRTGGYKFVDKPLKKLIDFINRNYNVNIILKNTVNEEVLFTGTIRKEESLIDILDKICISMDLKMRNEDGRIIELY